MSLYRKIIISVSIITTLLISSFVLWWNTKVSNHEIILGLLMLIESIMVILLIVDLFMDRKNKVR